jgi:hypothetical protein
MTVADFPETWRATVGRLRQNGEADLLLQSACFTGEGPIKDIRTRIGLLMGNELVLHAFLD